MALSMTVANSVGIGGSTYSQNITLSGTVVVNAQPTVAVAQAGVVTSGGTTTAATLTLGAGHGITTGQVVDIYWTGGRLLDATVGTVSGVSVPITATGTFEDGASAFPANTTAVYVSPRVSDAVGFVGNNIQGIVCNFPGNAGFTSTFSFFQSSTLEVEIPLLSGYSWNWYVGCGYTNPFAGLTISSVTYSNNETDVPITMRAGVLIT